MTRPRSFRFVPLCVHALLQQQQQQQHCPPCGPRRAPTGQPEKEDANRHIVIRPANANAGMSQDVGATQTFLSDEVPLSKAHYFS
ncbi:hypothetical protein F2P81_016692 [Scophthalmus maximus]|uniref:Uncharacterized protein n=1 Tax=Scophthalmus maximus TaxID=52904 RepID=A0A6A4SFV2_SCOMX|nr:hypothetical protein F2P81_016692 [Scophthalmus maximus]